MKIAIEAQRIFRENKHGMDFVALETIRHLQMIDKDNEYFIFVGPGKDYQGLSESENFHFIKLDNSNYAIWEQLSLPCAVRKIKPDLLHCTSNTAPICCKTPLLLTLHDIIFLEKRNTKSLSVYQNLGWYYRRFVVPKILNKCKTVITVSEFEAQRIRGSLPNLKPEIHAVYNGYSSHFKEIENPESISKKYIPHRDFIFFLGNTDPKKNTVRTIKAYSIYAKTVLNPLPLLIADLSKDVITEILKQENIEFVKHLIFAPGYISNKDLPYIYNAAKLFLYTSLRESFGIPMLEAMACGTPVITSNTSAMPEIAGAGATLVDPFKEEQIASMIIRLIDDKEYYQLQVKYGLERVKHFSWKKTAQELLNIYTSLNSKS
jgi:glycosyltransferase involved in cell wall biosynthesis